MIEFLIAPNPGPFTLDGTRSYVIDGEIVIDPGPNAASHIDAILERAPALRSILITHRHRDHAPAAAALAKRTGASVFAPPGVLGDDVVSTRLSDGLTIEGTTTTLTAIATPGHTAEHFCFLSTSGDLFTGDTILGEGTTAIFPPDGSMGDYMRSLKKLRALAPKRLFPGHGPTHDDAVAWIDFYIGHRIQRERQIGAALSEGASSVAEIRQLLYPDLDERLRDAAELQIEAHLEDMQERGVVRRSKDVDKVD